MQSIECFNLCSFVQAVNAEAKEEVINYENRPNFTGCDTASSHPTCGFSYFNNKMIQFSEVSVCILESLVICAVFCMVLITNVLVALRSTMQSEFCQVVNYNFFHLLIAKKHVICVQGYTFSIYINKSETPIMKNENEFSKSFLKKYSC